jgi:ATP-dependent RNA helicase SUPV3L1/SUV3
MGLNLNIRRVIFNSVFKFNGETVVRLDHSSVKQIAGRAGRRNSPYPNGQVTCRDPRDLEYIRESMENEIDNIEKAGLLPTAAHIQLFSEALQTYNLDYNDEDDDDEFDTSKSSKNYKFTGTAQLQPQQRYSDLYRALRQFSAMATVKGYFFLCRQTEMKLVARRLKGIPLPIRDAYTMCLSPTSDTSLQLLENFARKLSRGEVPGMPSNRVPKRAKSFDDLGYLCGIYCDADLFMWLQFKFPPTNAVEHQAALVRKEQSIAFINEALANSGTFYTRCARQLPCSGSSGLRLPIFRSLEDEPSHPICLSLELSQFCL